MNIQGVIPGGVPCLIELTKAGTTTLTVPANRIYFLDWVSCYYTTSADVGDRTVRITLTLVNLNGVKLTASLTIAASTSKTLTYNVISAIGTTVHEASAGRGAPLPLYPGQVLGLTLGGAFAGDTWSMEGVYYEVPFSCP